MAEVKLPDPKEWAQKLSSRIWLDEGRTPLDVLLLQDLAVFQCDTLRTVAQRLMREGLKFAANVVEKMAEEIR